MSYASATVINDTLYIGGVNCTTVNDNHFICMFSYKLTDDQWMRLPLLLQFLGVPTNINNNLCYIGGRDYSTGRSTNKVITLHNDHWITEYPNMSVGRSDHAVVSYQHHIIVAGGYDEDESVLDTIEVFNCDNNQWTVVSTHLPRPMRNINATNCNQSFIIAGYTGANGRANNSTYIIAMDSLVGTEQQQSLTGSASEDDNKWSELFPIPYWNAAIVPNTSPPVIIGGYDDEDKAVNNISLYDDSNDRWRTVSSLPISCAGATVATINDTIIVAGGYTDGSTYEAANATTLTSVVLGQLELCD